MLTLRVSSDGKFVSTPILNMLNIETLLSVYKLPESEKI